MLSRSEAEEHLRAIRSLMEKATIYRAISAQAAAVGGVLAIAASFAFGNWLVRPAAHTLSAGVPEAPAFFGLWLSVLAATASLNIYFLHRQAKRRDEPLVSVGMKLALRALAPSFLLAAALTWQFFDTATFVLIVPFWLACYGLALLATQTFAPRSLMWLGYAFISTALPAFTHVFAALHSMPDRTSVENLDASMAWSGIYAAQGWMASTFGLFHLIYAACTWPRKRNAESESGVQP